MKITKKFLRSLPIGTHLELDDVENVNSVRTMCNDVKRTEGKVSISVRTYPLERRVELKVLPYDRQGFQNTSQNQ